MTQRFPFAFAGSYRLPALLFGITPRRTYVEVTDDHLEARFGPWKLRTPRSNIASAEVTGGYSYPRTAGPAHLSLSDRGVTFATNGDAGLCVRFHEPVAVLDPTGRLLRHPGATFTVVDPEGLRRAIT